MLFKSINYVCIFFFDIYIFKTPMFIIKVSLMISFYPISNIYALKLELVKIYLVLTDIIYYGFKNLEIQLENPINLN